MAEYIEREAVLAAYDAAHKGEPGGARKLIAEAPAADVAPVRHGRWIEHEIPDEPLYGTDYECSVCGKFQFDNSNYCPNCGADMRGDTNG